MKTLFFKCFARIDQFLKFPCLNKGETGIQVGYDMTSPITSDLFSMARKAGRNGEVLAIDPDPWNHEQASQIIKRKKYTHVKLVTAGTFSEKTRARFLFGKKASWSQLGNIGIDNTVEYSGQVTEVNLNTLDNLLIEQQIPISKVGHVNITNNGAEYHTLLGFEKSLQKSEDLAITVIAGRYDPSGTIEDMPDYELIIDLLKKHGFQTKFRRIHQLFWWGVVVKLLVNRKWIFGKPNYGVIFAVKGRKRIPWYQSFS